MIRALSVVAFAGLVFYLAAHVLTFSPGTASLDVRLHSPPSP